MSADRRRTRLRRRSAAWAAAASVAGGLAAIGVPSLPGALASTPGVLFVPLVNVEQASENRLRVDIENRVGTHVVARYCARAPKKPKRRWPGGRSCVTRGVDAYEVRVFGMPGRGPVVVDHVRYGKDTERTGSQPVPAG